MAGLLDVIFVPIILTIRFLRDKFREWKEKKRKKKELKAAVVSAIDRTTNRVTLADLEGGTVTVEGAGIADEIHKDMIIIGDESFGEERPDILRNGQIQPQFVYGSASGQAFKGRIGQNAFFENTYFPGDGWEFSDYDNITFKYCLFHSKSPFPSTHFQRGQFKKWNQWSKCLSFTNVKRIRFEKCCFYNCNGVAVAETNVQSASFENCRFENCWLLHRQGQHYRALGALIHDYGNNGTNVIRHSEFVNCGGMGFDFLVLVSAYLSNCKCVVQQNRFEHCHHYHSYGNTNCPEKTDNDKDKKHTTLFLPGTVNEGNTLINSARIS